MKSPFPSIHTIRRALAAFTPISLAATAVIVVLPTLRAQQLPSPAPAPEAVTPTTDTTALLRQRSEQLRHIQAAYVENVAEGSIDPFAQLRQRLAKHAADIEELGRLHRGYLALPEDRPERRRVAATLRSSLAVFGDLLQVAQHPPGTRITISAAQTAELRQLEAARLAAQKSPPSADAVLDIVGSTERHSLLFLPVPIAVKARPGDTVFFESPMGGTFLENGLPVLAVTLPEADDTATPAVAADASPTALATATATWISRGEAVADCEVVITSRLAPEDTSVTIRVVQPTPIALPSPTPPTASPDQIPTAAPDLPEFPDPPKTP